MARTDQRWWQRALPIGLASLAAAVIVGCGGGGTDTASNGVGVGGTGAAAGPVAGYGSIIVNGVRFDFSGADFVSEDDTDLPLIGRTDGDTAPDKSADRPLDFGTMVDVRSGAIRQSGSYNLASANRITVISAVRGPISAIDANAGTLTVLGQSIETDAGTAYLSETNGSTTTAHDLSTLQLNDLVVVYGETNPSSGLIKATRIEYRSGSMTSYKVRGYVAGAPTATTVSFQISGLTIQCGGNCGTGVSNGQLVRVRLNTTPNGDGSYNALLVRNVNTVLSNGLVTRLAGVASAVDTSAKTLVINRVTVNYANATVTGGAPGNSKRIEVEGTVQNGVLVATKLTIVDESSSDFGKVKLIGSISALVAATSNSAGSFTLKGVKVSYTLDKLDAGVSSSLPTNFEYEVEGVMSTSTNTLIATRIKYED